MYKLAETFAAFCLQSYDLTAVSSYSYQSLSVCLIDCVYSLRAQYYTITLPVVDRYADRYMNGDRHAPGDTVSMLIQHIEATGGPKKFADEILMNHQKLGGKKLIPKEQICYQLAKYLQYLHIDTIEDFQAFESPELLEVVIRAVKGIGDAGVNYLFMLAGDTGRCKPDVHIHQCIKDACGQDISNDECQELFTDAVTILNQQYPTLTVRALDSIIWKAYQTQQQY